MPKSKTRYIVWICVEEFDEETGIGQDIDLPFASVTSFASELQAVEYAKSAQRLLTRKRRSK